MESKNENLFNLDYEKGLGAIVQLVIAYAAGAILFVAAMAFQLEAPIWKESTKLASLKPNTTSTYYVSNTCAMTSVRTKANLDAAIAANTLGAFLAPTIIRSYIYSVVTLVFPIEDITTEVSA